MKKQLNVGFAFFPYAGTSTGSSICYEVMRWFAPTMLHIRTVKKWMERIDVLTFKDFNDTPITMTRNAAVAWAKAEGLDVIIMVDSDMQPDYLVGIDPEAKPLWEVALDAIYDHYEKGPLVIGAPYCGAFPDENAMVFRWRSRNNDDERMKLDMYTREEAAVMSGLHDAAALPTGMIAYDLRAFDLIDHPYFDYQWTDDRQLQKASTEDVHNTRDISQAGIAKLGYNPVKCAWSSWSIHLKVRPVRKPEVITSDQVGERLRQAYEQDIAKGVRVVDLGSNPSVNQELLNKPVEGRSKVKKKNAKRKKGTR